MTDTAADPTDIDVVCLAAVAENGVIGRDGGMPWHYPADLAHFKETTMGHPVILGRRTYASIADRLGGPLPGRTNVVLTRSGLDEVPGGVVEAESVEAALSAAASAADEHGVEAAYVAGGATVYEQFLGRADRLVITEIPDSPEGDTYFPAFDCEAWGEIEREEREELAFVTYERR
jgi:dihydrofolate reductase